MSIRSLLILGLCVSASALAQSPDPPLPSTPRGQQRADKPGSASDGASRDPKAVEVLKEANEATPKIKSLTYTAEFSGEGFYLSRLGLPAGIRLTGSYTAATIEGGGGTKFRCEAKYTSAVAREVQEFSFGGNGHLFFFIDPDTKTVYQDTAPEVFGPRALIAIRGLRMGEYLSPAPFHDEIGVKKIELGSERIIGGVPCHEIHVQYARSNQEAYWYFGKKDHLPRGVRRVFANDGGEKSTLTLMISHLAVNPSFFVDPYTAIVHEGWTKNIEDVAP